VGIHGLGDDSIPQIGERCNRDSGYERERERKRQQRKEGGKQHKTPLTEYKIYRLWNPRTSEVGLVVVAVAAP
jgi:hypothetical protein